MQLDMEMDARCALKNVFCTASDSSGIEQALRAKNARYGHGCALRAKECVLYRK